MTSQVTLGVHWGNKILGHSAGAKRNFHRSGDYPLISHPKSHQADVLVCIGRELIRHDVFKESGCRDPDSNRGCCGHNAEY